MVCLLFGLDDCWESVKERVSGSDIFDVLRREGSASRPFKVFLFGGSDGVAETVCGMLNGQPSGMRCVGWHNPGFGTVEEMSSEQIIREVNESRADLLAVFFSAKKAQSWLLSNHHRFKISARGQFGATINYQAEIVRRAPLFFQQWGLEWLWRIKEEPYLWRRYFTDGVALTRMVVGRVMPIEINRRWHRLVGSAEETLQIVIRKERQLQSA